MDSDLNCPLCQQEFQDNNPPRLLIRCGHTFCQKCLKKIMTEKKGSYKLVCPEDGEMITIKDSNVNNFPKNIALMKIIQSKKNSVLDFKDPDFDVSKIVKTQQAQEDQDTRDLVASIISPNNTKSEDTIKIDVAQTAKQEKQSKDKGKDKQNIEQDKKKPGSLEDIKIQKKQKQLCKFHQKPLEVVCIIDLKKICANCAIFGQHKGHDFKSIQQIEKQRVEYYHSILSIMQKKQAIAQRISSEQTCSSIMQILSKKKQNLKKSISQKYQKLISTIQAKQKQSMKNLDSVLLKTESKLRNLMKIQPSTVQKYDTWQEKSYKEIKILEGDDFQAKLQLLFVGGNDNTQNQLDVLEEGDNIIEQMYRQEENLINQVELALENIGVQFNQDIFNYIDSFVEIYDQTKRKKSKGRTNKSQSLVIQNTNISSHPPVNKVSCIPPKKHQQIFPQQKLSQQKHFKIVHQQQKIQQKQQISSYNPQNVHNEQSLLQMQEQIQLKKPQLKQQHYSQSMKTTPEKLTIEQPLQLSTQKNLQKLISQFQEFQKNQLQRSSKPTSDITSKKSPPLTQRSAKDSSFSHQKPAVSVSGSLTDPVAKKKFLSKLKLPQKYVSTIQSLISNSLQTLDLTNAELGDATILLIAPLLQNSKTKTVKLIRNKLSDEAIGKILPYCGGLTVINLGQNLLTERVLDLLYDGRGHLKEIKSVVLSQNKIAERKCKGAIQRLKGEGILVSL